MLKLWGIVSPPCLAGHTSSSPEGGWNLIQSAGILATGLQSGKTCSLQAWLGGESPADTEGIRREGYPTPHPKPGKRIHEGPECSGGKRGLL